MGKITRDLARLDAVLVNSQPVLNNSLVDIVSEDLAVNSANNGQVFFNTTTGELKYVSDTAVVTITTS
jgi:hypothetical protein